MTHLPNLLSSTTISGKLSVLIIERVSPTYHKVATSTAPTNRSTGTHIATYTQGLFVKHVAFKVDRKSVV